MIEFTFLGTGNAFYTENDNFQSNILVTTPDHEKLLLDCGSDARRALAKMGLSYKDINRVYISHQHSDHIGGLEWLALSHYFTPNTPTPTLYCPKAIINDLWDHSLKGGLSTLETKTDLSTFFEVIACDEETPFEWNDITFTPVFSYHTRHLEGYMPCFGLWIDTGLTKIFFTSDSKFSPDYQMPFYEKADIIFQDCETVEHPSGVHAHYQELKHLPPDIKKKMRLYHYHSLTKFDAEKDGFHGFVKPQIPIEIT
jgi:ribonuclease BN (tRNA processing enzyme)